MRCSGGLDHDGVDLGRQFAERQFFELHFRAGVVDINPDQVPARIVIKYDPFGNFLAVHTRLLRQINVQ
jgi:hypothetical protein